MEIPAEAHIIDHGHKDGCSFSFDSVVYFVGLQDAALTQTLLSLAHPDPQVGDEIAEYIAETVGGKKFRSMCKIRRAIPGAPCWGASVDLGSVVTWARKNRPDVWRASLRKLVELGWDVDDAWK